MFDRGIYLANIISKSENYCISQLAIPPNYVALLALSEVALGSCSRTSKCHEHHKLSANMHSTKGVGQADSYWIQLEIIRALTVS